MTSSDVILLFYKDYYAMLQSQANLNHPETDPHRQRPQTPVSNLIRRQPCQQRAPAVFLTMFFTTIIFQILVLRIAVNGGEPISFTLQAAAWIYVSDGIILFFGYFIDCRFAFDRFIDAAIAGLGCASWIDFPSDSTSTDDHQAEPAWIVSVRAVVDAEIAAMVVVFWPLAFSWLVALWINDGVVCYDVEEEEDLEDREDSDTEKRGWCNELTPLISREEVRVADDGEYAEICVFEGEDLGVGGGQGVEDYNPSRNYSNFRDTLITGVP
ncbi:uncharacterized protein CTRU02_210587 [Colletotrichum truncatum]|uniref:Uncharacterized protein n=1 Tax=Colletotrichum truncatum TaxID=5467 RepID=A0ACC3YPF0_COLTU|nr:uncharacterized protein CTRU02_12790 [Colletotrichum truncatum]KAF6784261.1 hypothetical protein CTRU02_12790 [Colletotrichum truncatum]